MPSSEQRRTFQLAVRQANPRASSQLAKERKQLAPWRARRVIARELLEFIPRECNHWLLRLRKIFGKKLDGQMIHVFESFPRDRAVQQDYVAPVLLGHVPVCGNEAVNSSVVPVRDDAALAFCVICQAVA